MKVTRRLATVVAMAMADVRVDGRERVTAQDLRQALQAELKPQPLLGRMRRVRLDESAARWWAAAEQVAVRAEHPQLAPEHFQYVETADEAAREALLAQVGAFTRTGRWRPGGLTAAGRRGRRPGTGWFE
jgi:hypothetical protein